MMSAHHRQQGIVRQLPVSNPPGVVVYMIFEDKKK